MQKFSKNLENKLKKRKSEFKWAANWNITMSKRYLVNLKKKNNLFLLKKDQENKKN